MFALNVTSAKFISLPASERFILWCRQVWVFHSSCPLISVKSAAGRCRWGGVPAPLSQPEHQGSSTNIFKKEESWVKITAQQQVSLHLCVLGKKQKSPSCKQTNSLQSFQLQSKFASIRTGIATCWQISLAFYSISWQCFPDAQRHFIILSVSVSKELLATPPSLCLCVGVDSILEYVQVVGGCYGDDILWWVPGHVQDLFGKVQTIHSNVSAAPLAASVNSPGPQHSPRLAAFPPGLQGHSSARLPVEHPEEAVVRPSHDDAEEWRNVVYIMRCHNEEGQLCCNLKGKDRQAKAPGRVIKWQRGRELKLQALSWHLQVISTVQSDKHRSIRGINVSKKNTDMLVPP